MEILYLLIPISLVLVFVIGVAFFWSVRGGQYDDLEGPAHRILLDDDRPRSVRERAANQDKQQSADDQSELS